jgi:hypothetical protein
MFWVGPVEVTVQRVCRFQPFDARRTPVGLFLVIVIVHLKMSFVFHKHKEKLHRETICLVNFFFPCAHKKRMATKKEEFEETFDFTEMFYMNCSSSLRMSHKNSFFFLFFSFLSRQNFELFFSRTRVSLKTVLTSLLQFGGKTRTSCFLKETKRKKLKECKQQFNWNFGFSEDAPTPN